MGIREQRSEKRYLTGTHRACSPPETWARFSPRAADFGITRLANLTGLDVIGLPVVTAVRPQGRSLATTQGKGLELVAAKTSALMEAIELWHAERLQLPVRHASARELAAEGTVAIELAQVPLRPGAQPNPHAPILWVQGEDLLGQEPCWVPLELVSMNWVMQPHQGSQLTFAGTSTGLASGNTLLEATVHALCEVIERDASTLWLEEGIATRKRRQLNLPTVTSADCLPILQLLERAPVQVAAWDMTSDLGIPAYACTVMDASERPEPGATCVASGYGCHLASGIALSRALCEAVQSRATVIAGSRDDFLLEDYERALDPTVWQAVRSDAFATPATLRWSEAALATRTFEGDLEVILAALKKAGVGRAVAVDLTRAELGVPVVKVVVSGVEGTRIAPGYRPGGRMAARAAQSPAQSPLQNSAGARP